jgi:hypothetical protein
MQQIIFILGGSEILLTMEIYYFFFSFFKEKTHKYIFFAGSLSWHLIIIFSYGYFAWTNT